MKYVKTFENFNYDPTNEGLLWGEGSIWSKLGNWWSNWKSRKMKEGAEMFKKIMQKYPQVQKLWDKTVQPVLDKLSPKDVQELSDKTKSFKGDEPSVEVSTSVENLAEVQGQGESLRTQKGSKIYEAYSLILEEVEDRKVKTAQMICKWFAIPAQYVGVISCLLGVVLYITNAGIATAAASGAGIIGGPVMLGMIFGGLALAAAGLLTKIYSTPEKDW